jgi:phosphoglycerate dehydrogenase-like enzyme
MSKIAAISSHRGCRRTLRAATGTAVLSLALAALWAPTSWSADDPAAVAKLVKDLGLRESAIPVRERKGWRPPKKAVVIGSSRDLVASALPGVEVVAVRDASAAKEVAADADILVGLSTETGVCNAQVVDNARELRWIMSMSAGVDACLKLPSVHSRNLIVTNTRGLGSANIAEHVVAMAMTLARGLDMYVLQNQTVVDGKSSDTRPPRPRMQVLAGKTMLVAGLGAIGTEVAKRGHALGMKVVATRASGRHGPEFVSYVGLPDELLTLAKSADVIVNALPLTKETVGIYDAKFFRSVKPNLLFINIARGQSVVTAELVAALNEGRIAGAGLDVTDPDVLPPDHPLRRAPRVILTPHVSGGSDLPPEDRMIVLRENLRRYAAGEKMLSVVDLEREY